MEIRIESMNKGNSHSWVRISHGLNKLVTNLNNKDQDDNEQETSEMQFEDYALKLNASDFASRSKAKAKPQPQIYSLSEYLVSKKLINFLRHGILPRENDGAIEFWRIKEYLQDHFVFCHAILYLRAFQGHSGRNLIDPSLQDNVVIPDGFFKYI